MPKQSPPSHPSAPSLWEIEIEVREEPACSRHLARLLSLFFGIVAGSASVSVLMACEFYVHDVSFSSALMRASLAPVGTALVTMPTAATVLTIAVMLRRHISKKLAMKSLVATLGLSVAMLAICTVFSVLSAASSDFSDDGARITVMCVLILIGIAQSFIVAPVYGYIYASSCRPRSPISVTYTVVGVSVAPIVYALPHVVCPSEVATAAFAISIPVYAGAAYLLREYSLEVEEDAPGADDEHGGRAETRLIFRRAWQPLFNLFVIDVASNCVFPSLCWKIRPAQALLSRDIFSTLVVFVMPNLGSVAGSLLQTVWHAPLKRTELAVGVVRAVLLLGSIAVSNFDAADITRTWTRTLIHDDIALLALLTFFYVVSGYLVAASYATAAHHTGAKAAPRAAKLGSCAQTLGSIVGLALAVAFPYLL